ncbi:MAG: cobalt-precorrin-5B (C(1))-methyltransferase [Geobacteraceae bacterium]|nr:cobalt-precorrin-5B (C(1))-methyltransferase [Geobacteraceae bacterium]
MKKELFHKPSTALRSGYTTGACAAAAAKGAALMLAHQITVREVTIELPTGDSATFRLSGQSYSRDAASCFVIKDAGDDPDVTNGAEVHASVLREKDASTVGEGLIVIIGGKGVGRITKPGLAVPPGQWAINPVPRRMIKEAVACVVYPKPESRTGSTDSYTVVISIPDGEERAKKTLNTRLGIIGGLSILGTTGIVRPVSAKAWTDTIDAALDVSKACGCENVVLSTGRTSESAAQNFLRRQNPGSHHAASLFDPPPTSPDSAADSWNYPDESFIMMGDHISYALKACQARSFTQPIITCQFAKLLKIACGHENTHAAASELDLEKLHKWGREEGLSDLTLSTISAANTAREIAISSSFDPGLLKLVFQHARRAVLKHAPEITVQFLVADYSGNCIFDSR